jgi:integrase/recombinase XerC
VTQFASFAFGDALPLAQAARIVREAEAMRDKSYRQHPLGQEWGRFLRAKRLAGCQPNTILSYETVGRLFTLRYADFDSLEPFAGKEGPELALDFLERNWGDADRQTLDQRTAVMRSFFEWAYRVDRISADPMRKIEKRRRKRQGARRQRIPAGPLARIVSGRDNLRDQVAILLLGRLGLRREDLRLLQIADIDLGRDELHLRHAKGGEEHVLPIGFPDVREALYLHLQAERREPGEFLLYPKTERTRPVLMRRYRQLVVQRCAARAGVVGYTMHQLRHAAGDDLNRATGSIYDAKELMRHKSVATTEVYLHTGVDDLRRAIEQLSKFTYAWAGRFVSQLDITPVIVNYAARRLLFGATLLRPGASPERDAPCSGSGSRGSFGCRSGAGVAARERCRR